MKSIDDGGLLGFQNACPIVRDYQKKLFAGPVVMWPYVILICPPAEV